MERGQAAARRVDGRYGGCRVRRFLLGLILGAAGSGITWGATEHPGWTAIVGIVVAVLVWFGELILDDLI